MHVWLEPARQGSCQSSQRSVFRLPCLLLDRVCVAFRPRPLSTQLSALRGIKAREIGLIRPCHYRTIALTNLVITSLSVIGVPSSLIMLQQRTFASTTRVAHDLLQPSRLTSLFTCTPHELRGVYTTNAPLLVEKRPATHVTTQPAQVRRHYSSLLRRRGK